MTAGPVAQLPIQPALHIGGGHWASVSDVQGMRTHVQRRLQAVEGLTRVIVEWRIGRAVLQQTEEAAREHVTGDQVALIKQD